MNDFTITQTWTCWRLCYDSFHRSKPYLGIVYHQLCVGPFVFEWTTGGIMK
jgi:hypothetical protein